MDIKGKKILIVGLKRSGLGSALLLSRLGANVTVTDTASYEMLREYIERLPEDVKMRIGGHEENDFFNADMIVLSPGVRSDMEYLKRAEEKGIEVIGEVELAYRLIRDGMTPLRNDIPFYAITGTNGKSTTTTLLYLILKEHGLSPLLCGNIGNAITYELFRIMNNESTPSIDSIVMEMSSFQLETIRYFRPQIGAILNLTPDHLDRYKSFRDYCGAKILIALNQTESDYLVLNADDKDVMYLYHLLWETRGPKVVFFKRTGEFYKEGFYLRDRMISYYFTKPDLSFEAGDVIKVDELGIRGAHNIENALAASTMAFLAGASIDAIRDILKSFRGLPHRMEFVRNINGVDYINDSKGTNVGAVIKSLEGLRNVILILGGRDKKSDFRLLRPYVKDKVKALILIGEAREKIKDALGDLVDTYISGSMEEAVHTARNIARDGDTVLLSPGCASFDMFRDFEERGDVFRKIVEVMT